MRFAGLTYTKINIEKKENTHEDIKVETNINISDIKKTEVRGFEIKEDLINVKFSYIVRYAPDFAELVFEGNILFSMDQKESKEILKEWENKKILNSFKLALFNIILKKSNLKALQLEEDLNLPLHIPFPSINKIDKKED